MAQPTLTGLTLNAGSGGSDLAYDLVNSQVVQVILPAYSTGDGAMNVAMEDYPFPVRLSNGTSFVDGATEAKQDTANTALAAIQTAAEIMDDWDETNRAAVNLIASQVGITGGAGAVAANTPRTTLASDDPAVALLGTIDADTSAIRDCVAGVLMQVDVIASDLPSGAATAANQSTANTALAAIQTAVEAIDDPVATVSATPLMRVGIFDDSDSQITSFGGGTQYSVDTALGATPTGTLAVAIRDDTLSSLTPVEGDAIGLRVDANGALWVIPSGTVTISGTVTANAGTNLNTSALALEAGGNLAAVAASLDVLDDWDETNRCAVNLIAAQTGITAGAGAVAANTPRMTLASDDPGVALLGTIDADTSALFGCVAGNEIQVDVVGSLPGGTNAIGKLAANSGVDIGDVDVTSISAGSNLIGDVGIQTRQGNGASVYYDNDLDETAVAVKAGAGTLLGAIVINLATAVRYLQFFNVAQGSVTVGMTTPTFQIPIPTQGDANGAGFVIPLPPQGVNFDTAITAAATTNNEGNGAPGANEIQLVLFYA